MDNMIRGPEALEWLKSNKNESALASNRFGPTSEAIKFIEQLYALGAERVIVFQDAIRDDEEIIEYEDGPYADALVVILPSDQEKRERVTKICAEEITSEGFDPSESENKDAVFLWWD